MHFWREDFQTVCIEFFYWKTGAARLFKCSPNDMSSSLRLSGEGPFDQFELAQRRSTA
jgi:hypothetical protein